MNMLPREVFKTQPDKSLSNQVRPCSLNRSRSLEGRSPGVPSGWNYAVAPWSHVGAPMVAQTTAHLPTQSCWYSHCSLFVFYKMVDTTSSPYSWCWGSPLHCPLMLFPVAAMEVKAFDSVLSWDVLRVPRELSQGQSWPCGALKPFWGHPHTQSGQPTPVCALKLSQTL